MSTWTPDRSEGDRARERRRTPFLQNYRYWGSRGRRKSVRRREDKVGTYVDWYEPRLSLTAIAILLLCILDAILTLHLLHHGAFEANWLMAALLAQDLHLFAVVKLSLTALGVLFLVVHAHFTVFRRFRVARVLDGLLLLYLCLVGYELMLLHYSR